MESEIVADPMGAVWSKFVFNCVMNPLGALMMGDNSSRHDSPEMRALIDDMAAECKAVVTALGGTFAFPPMEFVDKVRAGEIPLSKHAGSMALDIARGAPTEIDELTGAARAMRAVATRIAAPSREDRPMMRAQAGMKTRPTILVVGERLSH